VDGVADLRNNYLLLLDKVRTGSRQALSCVWLGRADSAIVYGGWDGRVSAVCCPAGAEEP
jgi:hypothetical protein